MLISQVCPLPPRPLYLEPQRGRYRGGGTVAYPVPGTCPVCGETLAVRRLHCRRCDTGVEGHFEMPRLARLSPEQQVFVETFLKVRGNIREMERELGVSYPTVRSRLDEI